MATWLPSCPRETTNNNSAHKKKAHLLDDVHLCDQQLSSKTVSSAKRLMLLTGRLRRGMRTLHHSSQDLDVPTSAATALGSHEQHHLGHTGSQSLGASPANRGTPETAFRTVHGTCLQAGGPHLPPAPVTQDSIHTITTMISHIQLRPRTVFRSKNAFNIPL